MKKAIGLIFILALAFGCFLLLKECKSTGGGNSPLTKTQLNLEAHLWA